MTMNWRPTTAGVWQITRRGAIRFVLIVISALFAWGGTPNDEAHAQASEKTGVVHLSSGDVQGLTVNGVGQFLGIPYAAPPVGELRWRPPQEPARWTQTLQADKV